MVSSFDSPLNDLSLAHTLIESFFFCDLLQPENVLLDASYRVRLCDYGLAVGCDSDERLKFVGGTEKFMAPEVNI